MDSQQRNEIILGLHPWVTMLATVWAGQPWARHARTQIDAASIASLALIEAVHSFDPTRGVPVKAWVFLKVRGAIRDHWRKLARWQRELPLPDSQESPAGGFAPFFKRRLTDSLLAASGLAPHERDLIRRRFWEEKPLAEIAKTLAVSPSSAARTLEGGLDKMRRYVSEQFRREGTSLVCSDCSTHTPVRIALRHADHCPARTSLNVLTAKQRQIALLLAEGKTGKEVAWELGISPRTVDVHKMAIFKRLGIKRTVQLARLMATDLQPLHSEAAC